MLTLPYDINCGYFDCSEFGNLCASPKRETQKFEIELYLEDARSTFTDGKEYMIKKDYIKISKPKQIRYSLLPFKTMYLKFSAEDEIAEKLCNAPEYFCSSHPAEITNKLDEIILLKESGNNEILLQSRLLSFLNLVLYDSEVPKPQSGRNYKIISSAKRYMETNCDKSVNLEDIANSVNLSRIYFHNIFTDACGMTPHDYLTECRIAKAKKLLWDTDVPMDYIAEKCGFGCQQYFNKIFKKQTGTTPGRYRKEIQQGYLDNR